MPFLCYQEGLIFSPLSTSLSASPSLSLLFFLLCPSNPHSLWALQPMVRSPQLTPLLWPGLTPSSAFFFQVSNSNYQCTVIHCATEQTLDICCIHWSVWSNLWLGGSFKLFMKTSNDWHGFLTSFPLLLFSSPLDAVADQSLSEAAMPRSLSNHGGTESNTG